MTTSTDPAHAEKQPSPVGNDGVASHSLRSAPPFAQPDAWYAMDVAPKDGREVLAAEYGGPSRICFWDEARGGIWSMWPGRERFYPTLWRYLPDAPTYQQASKGGGDSEAGVQANTESPEPVPVDELERAARIIDPSTWRVLDNYLAEVKRRYAGQDAAFDPDAFRDKTSLVQAAEILSPILSRLKAAEEAVQKQAALKHKESQSVSFWQNQDAEKATKLRISDTRAEALQEENARLRAVLEEVASMDWGLLGSLASAALNPDRSPT